MSADSSSNKMTNPPSPNEPAQSAQSTLSSDKAFSPEASYVQSDCAVCHAETATLCSVCKGIRYCSKECQTMDWNRHKRICKQYSKTPPRPSDDHVLYLLFPCDEPYPRLKWLNRFDTDSYQEIIQDGVELPTEAISIDRDFGDTENGYRNLKFPLAVYFRSWGAYPTSSLKPNMALYSITGSASVARHWLCNIVIQVSRAPEGCDEDDVLPADITLADYRYALNYLEWYTRKYGTR